MIRMPLDTRFKLTTVGKIIYNSFRKDKPISHLGRWKINKNVGLWVDYSNEDHCGTCSEIVLIKKKQYNI